MMHNFFECKIRYEKVMEDGKEKKVLEPYLVDAMSFSEAEARIVKEMECISDGGFTIEAIKRYGITELFENVECEPSIYFEVKANFITLDEKSGMEKKQASYYLVQSCDIRNAQKFFDEKMKETMLDYQVEKIVETKIQDIFKI